MSQVLQWGVLGTANIARNFIRGVHQATRSHVAAIASRDTQKAAAFARATNVPCSYGSYEQLLADPKIQAVYIPLPNALHSPWTIKALEAGKHVLCEKPLASNTAEAKKMFETADRLGLILAEAFMYRSHPLIHDVAHVVHSGQIGKLLLIRSCFGFKLAPGHQADIRFSTQMAGGSLMDIGCYCINLSRHLAQAEPVEITGLIHRHPSGVDDTASGSLLFPNGTLSNFISSMSMQIPSDVHIYGKKGRIAIPSPWLIPQVNATYTVTRFDPPRSDQNLNGTAHEQTFSVTADKPLYALEADDFAATVFDGKPQTISHEDSLGNMAVLDELRKQAQIPILD